MARFPRQRWQIQPGDPAAIDRLVQTTGLLPLVAQVVLNRGMVTPAQSLAYIDPESETLPDPLVVFPDLALAVDLLVAAIAEGETITICGDYDADGMTSTALLWRTLQKLGVAVNYHIPSRMSEGYGINKRIVEDCAAGGTGLIITVDNGISALEPIAHARALGLDVIITDHHDLPEQLPPANAILNPKRLDPSCPYYGLAGVGVAYLLARCLADRFPTAAQVHPYQQALFTLGTIADLAPLVGVNRRWLKQGLQVLPQCDLAGIQALIQVSGVSDQQKQMKPDDIGFRLGPRINAIGRIDDPARIIQLLTTDDPGQALELAMYCEGTNKQRQELCDQIEGEAIALIEETPIPYDRDRVLVLLKEGWHHGVIGIVASRLVERYGVPVFICTYEGEKQRDIRGSARSIPEFHIHEALTYCHDLLGKYGGHRAAGGFSLVADQFPAFQARLSEFAHQCLEPEHLKPLITIDAKADFNQITPYLYQQLDRLQPWGIENPEPIFWTPQVRVVDQQTMGKSQDHIRVTFSQEIDGQSYTHKAVAWRWRDYFPLPDSVDIAYKIKENHWNGETALQLNLVAVRPSLFPAPPPQGQRFMYGDRCYSAILQKEGQRLQITNDQGKVLTVNKGDKMGSLGDRLHPGQTIDVRQSPYYEIIRAALQALETSP